MSRVYIAGPMSGKPAYNHFEFEKAARAWRQLGHEVVTPFEANSIAWRRVYGRDFDPYVDKCDWGDPMLTAMLGEDFLALLGADRMALLDGWRHSKGSRSEIVMASNVGKPIYCASTFREYDLTPHIIIEGGFK